MVISSPFISTTIWHWNSAAIPPIPTPVIQSTLTLASTRRSTTVADFGHGTTLMDEDVCNRLRDVKNYYYCTVRELIRYSAQTNSDGIYKLKLRTKTEQQEGKLLHKMRLFR